MFPLGSVLLPGMVLPLHVFEPRYRRLVQDVLAADRQFGVVLIERGHEVGGGDSRTNVGTVAEVVRAEELDDGRWLVIAVGRHRIRVEQWQPDDPYPRAQVAPWPDDPAPADEAVLADVSARLRRVLDLAAELGDDVPEVDMTDWPVESSFQAVALSPVGPLDRQALLCQPDPARRLTQLTDLLEGHEQVLRFRLGDR